MLTTPSTITPATLVGLVILFSPPPPAGAQEKSATGVIVEPDERPAEATRRLLAQRELELLEEALRDPSRLLESLRLTAPEEEIGDPLKALLERREELRDLLADLPEDPLTRWRPEPLPPRTPVEALARDLLRAAMGTSDLPDRRLVPRVFERLPPILQQQRQECRIIWIGALRASDFRLYPWWGPTGRARGAMAFWPLSDTSQLPNQTPTTGWTDETGANFWGWEIVPGRWPWDPVGAFAQALVLEFAFPAPPCDATLCWGTRARAEAPTPWTLAADFASIDTDWVVREAPDGSGFPASIMSYSFDASGLLRDTRGADVSEVTTSLDGCFEVSAGVSAKVQLGASLLLWAKDGRASTIDVGGIGDHFSFQNGVVFIMAASQ